MNYKELQSALKNFRNNGTELKVRLNASLESLESEYQRICAEIEAQINEQFTAVEEEYIDPELVCDAWQQESDVSESQTVTPVVKTQAVLLLPPAKEVVAEEETLVAEISPLPTPAPVVEIEEMKVHTTHIRSHGRIASADWQHEPRLSELPQILGDKFVALATSAKAEALAEIASADNFARCFVMFALGFRKGLANHASKKKQA